MPYQLSKSEVGYQRAGYSQTEFCRACKSLDIKTSRCSRVMGRVGYGNVCDLFERDPDKHSLPPRSQNCVTS